MSKRHRPTTAAQAAHRTRRHAYRSAMNSPEGKAVRASGKTVDKTLAGTLAKIIVPAAKSTAPVAAKAPAAAKAKAKAPARTATKPSAQG
jgi:hypothetical protein